MRRILVQTSMLLTALAAGMPRATRAAESDAAGLFAKLDANGDGQLAADEVDDEQRLLFKRLIRTGDEDSDGRLTAEEFALAIQPVRAEKPTVKKQGSRLPGADALLVLLVKMDANGDQQLVADEIPADYRRAFEQMLTAADDDKNGRLDRREIAQGSPKLTAVASLAVRRMGLDVAAEMDELPAETMSSMEQMDAYPKASDFFGGAAKSAKLFDRLDADGDGLLVAKEAVGPLAERIDEMIDRGDRDHDGKLSKKEFLDVVVRLTSFDDSKPAPEAIRQAKRQLLTRFDRDGDRALTKEESPPRIRQNFDRTDLDGDGQLRGEELNQVAERMARMAPNAENRNGSPRPAMNEDSPGRKPSRKLKGKPRAEKNVPI
jgi:Ca2+-binding EF-hand superfamily protein